MKLSLCKHYYALVMQFYCVFLFSRCITLGVFDRLSKPKLTSDRHRLLNDTNRTDGPSGPEGIYTFWTLVERWSLFLMKRFLFCSIPALYSGSYIGRVALLWSNAPWLSYKWLFVKHFSPLWVFFKAINWHMHHIHPLWCQHAVKANSTLPVASLASRSESLWLLTQSSCRKC